MQRAGMAYGMTQRTQTAAAAINGPNLSWKLYVSRHGVNSIFISEDSMRYL